AGTYRLERIGAGDVAFDQVGQLQVLEHEVEKLFLGDLEHKVVHAFAAVAGLARTAAAPAALRAGDALAGDEILVARVNDGLAAATVVVRHWTVDIPTGNADLLAMLHVGDGAPADGFLHRSLDTPTVTLQKALAVPRALVLAIQATVDHIAHASPPG